MPADRAAAAAASPDRAAPAGTAYLIAALPPLFWSGNFLLARLMRDEMPPLQMSFWRWVLALAILLPFCLGPLRADWPKIRGNLPFLAFLGLIGVTAFNCLVYIALHHTTVVNAALVNALLPVVTFLFAYLFLKQRLARRQLWGVLISIAGAVLIICQGDLDRLLRFAPNSGDVLVFAGMSCWALYTVLVRWRPAGLQPLALLGVTMAFGTIFHLPPVIWEYSRQGGFSPGAGALAAIAYFAIFPSILAYILWNRSIVLLGPAKTAIFMHLLPVFSIVLAILFLGETLRLHHLAGFAAILSGVLLVTNPGKSR
jgi:drug/metabolite transporter (DMT)-like permease